MGRKAVPVQVGAKYGNLEVIRDLETRPRKVLVRCSCGKEEHKYLTVLTTGKQTQCSSCSPKGLEKELKGQRFGRLFVLEESYKINGKGKRLKAWKTVCDCGNVCVVLTASLMSGNTKGCGHDCKALIHPLRGTPTQVSWSKMMSRVNGHYDSVKDCWVDVTVCDRWNPSKGGSFENFAEDMGPRPEGCTLNRVRGAKIYSKETCEWATLSLQSFDQRRSNNNTSGRTGVRWRKDRNVWEAVITVDKKVIQLYYGESFEMAVKAREEAEVKYYGFTKE